MLVLIMSLCLSGVSCLIYQIAWSRLLLQSFGSTLPAISTLLTIYFSGLALGAYISSLKWTNKGKPLVVYALLQITIAAFGVISAPICRSDIAPTLLFFTLLLPTTMMGASLPVMCRLCPSFTRPPESTSAYFYAFNTVGSVIGAFLAGFILMPSFGIEKTTQIGAIGNLIAAIFAILPLFARKIFPQLNSLPSASETAALSDSDEYHQKLLSAQKDKFTFVLCMILALSGLLTMTLEIVWTRYFILVFGSTTYAFAAVTTVVLSGLALGAVLVSKSLKKVTEPLSTIALAFLATALLSYIGMRMLDSIPGWYMTMVSKFIGPTGDISFNALLAIQFLIVFLVAMAPMLTAGTIFPLSLKAVEPSSKFAYHHVGQLFAANTLGSIAGSWLAGFVFIPLLSDRFPSGVEATLFGTCLLLLLLATTTYFFCFAFPDHLVATPDRRLLVSYVSVILIFSYMGLPKWDSLLLASGITLYPIQDFDFRKLLSHREALGQLLFYKEGQNSTVSVVQLNALNVRVLKNNGKSEAALPIDATKPAPTSDLPTQVLLGQLPILIHPSAAEKVLVIGFGSGATCGSILKSSDVKQLTSVELEKDVYTASKYFEPVNNFPLPDNDKRFKPLVADGRHFLVKNSDKYDLIVSQPADPWVSGVSDLYTKEFWQLAASRLLPDGIFCQWVQLYDITPEYLAVILRTFQTVFPSTYIFHNPEAAEIIVVGSKIPFGLDSAQIQKRIRQKGTRKDLARVGVNESKQIISMLALTPDDVHEMTDAIGRQTGNYALNTNDNLLTEFQLPRLMTTRERVREECLHMLAK